MKEQWTEPTLKDLSVVETEAAIDSKPVHDGVTYDTQYGVFEGHRS